MRLTINARGIECRVLDSAGLTESRRIVGKRAGPGRWVSRKRLSPAEWEIRNAQLAGEGEEGSPRLEIAIREKWKVLCNC